MPVLNVSYMDLREDPDPILLTNVLEDSIVIESVMGQVIDTCQFRIYDKNKSIEIRTLVDIIVTREDTGERVFAGLCSMISGEVVGPTRYWDISAQDYTLLLDKSLCLQNYPPDYRYTANNGVALVGDRAIIAAAFEVDTVGVNGGSTDSEIDAVTHVDQGISSLSQQAFKYSTLREVIAQLAQYVGFEYFVDYDKRLHFYYREDEAAPYELTDGEASTTAVNYRNVRWKRDGTRLINTFALFGDRLIADTQVTVLSTNGSQRTFNLGFATVGLNVPLIPEPGLETIGVSVNANSNRPLTENEHDGMDGVVNLFVTGANFVDDGVLVGDIVINQDDGSYGEIRAVAPTTLTAQLRGGVTNVWNSGDRAVVPTWTDISVSADPNEPNPNRFGAVHRPIEQTLVFRLAPTSNTFGIRLRYAYTFAAAAVETDTDSVNRYQDRVFSRRVIVSDVNSVQGLQEKMGHLQQQYADALEVVTLTITDDMFPTKEDFIAAGESDTDAEELSQQRFMPGQWVCFRNSVLNDGDDRLNPKEFLIHRVVTRVLKGEILEYELELRDWEVDLV